MNTVNPWGGGGVGKANNLTAIYDPIVYKIWERQQPFTFFQFELFLRGGAGGKDDEGNAT
jgi:hypothetical protein